MPEDQNIFSIQLDYDEALAISHLKNFYTWVGLNIPQAWDETTWRESATRGMKSLIDRGYLQITGNGTKFLHGGLHRMIQAVFNPWVVFSVSIPSEPSTRWIFLTPDTNVEMQQTGEMQFALTAVKELKCVRERSLSFLGINNSNDTSNLPFEIFINQSTASGTTGSTDNSNGMEVSQVPQEIRELVVDAIGGLKGFPSLTLYDHIAPMDPIYERNWLITSNGIWRVEDSVENESQLCIRFKPVNAMSVLQEAESLIVSPAR